MRLFLGLISLFAYTTSALAHDTGYHNDLTGAVLREFGLKAVPIKVVQVENWLTDYYSNAPTAPAAVKQELAKLHFDNLFTSKEVSWYWARLSENTIAAAKQAALDNDTHRMLTILAISMHAVQDFYSHSNWCSTHSRPASGYSTATFLSAGIPANAELFTGFYDSMSMIQPAGRPSHGGYNEGLNRDSQVRPGWDEAYVFAFAASWEWVAKLKEEVATVNPNFWEAVKNFSLNEQDLTKLDNDAKAAYRISLWIAASGADGHWKGNRSGHSPSFITSAAEWSSSTNSISVKQFKEKAVQNLLTPNLYQGGVPPATPAFPKFNLQRSLLTVRFLNVEEKGDEGLLEPRIDLGGNADFFARVTIDGVEYIERVIQDQKSFNDPWWVLAFVDSTKPNVALGVEVMDEDVFASGDDDTCDINPAVGKKRLDFTAQLSNAALAGDINGTHRDALNPVEIGGKKPDTDRAVIRFLVDSQNLIVR